MFWKNKFWVLFLILFFCFPTHSFLLLSLWIHSSCFFKKNLVVLLISWATCLFIFILSCISRYIQINKEKKTPKSDSVPAAVSRHCPHLPILIRNVEVEREANSKERCAGWFFLSRRNPQVQGEESQFPEHTLHDSRTPSPLASPDHCTHSFGGITIQRSNPITKSRGPKRRPSGKRTGSPRGHSTRWNMQE